MAKLHFEPKHHQDITHLLSPIKASDQQACLTFIINKTHCLIIGGVENALQVLTIDIEPEWALKPGQWMLYASSFKEYWSQQAALIDQKVPVMIHLNYHDNPKLPMMDSLTDRQSRLYIQSEPALPAHLEFLEFTRNASCQTLATDSACVMMEMAETYRPFDSFEITEKQVVIDRDKTLLPFDLPEEIKPDCHLLLNKDSVDQLTHLCTTTDAPTIEIHTDDERAMFSDGKRTFTSSLLSLKGYAQKKTDTYQQELKMIVDIFTFKNELESYRKIAQLKKANEALLYVAENKVMLAGLIPETGENCFISTKEIKIKHPTIYRINLSEVSKINIKGITEAKTIKLCMLKNKEGGYKLGFYNDRNNDHPYNSVYDVAHAPEKMSAVLKAKAKLEQQIDEDEDEDGEQGDIFGFDDV
ncbi:MAG: hypothetical protein ACTH6O_05445 [Vibrio toranzoniae]